MKNIRFKYKKFMKNYKLDVDKAIDETFKIQKDKIIRLVQKIKNVKKIKERL